MADETVYLNFVWCNVCANCWLHRNACQLLRQAVHMAVGTAQTRDSVCVHKIRHTTESEDTRQCLLKLTCVLLAISGRIAAIQRRPLSVILPHALTNHRSPPAPSCRTRRRQDGLDAFVAVPFLCVDFVLLKLEPALSPCTQLRPCARCKCGLASRWKHAQESFRSMLTEC